MRLIDYLSSQEMKPSAFAAIFGVPPSTVMRWMRGERQPRVESLLKIQEITNGAVMPNDFLPSPPAPALVQACEAAEG